MSARRVSPVLVGRESHVDALERACEAATGGTPQVVLVGTEAGGGKSRLVSQFTARVQGRALVLSGGCGSKSCYRDNSMTCTPRCGWPQAPAGFGLRRYASSSGP